MADKLYRVARRDVKSGLKNHNTRALTLGEALDAAQTGNALCQGHVEFWPELIPDMEKLLHEVAVVFERIQWGVPMDNRRGTKGCPSCYRSREEGHTDGCVVKEVLSL